MEEISLYKVFFNDKVKQLLIKKKLNKLDILGKAQKSLQGQELEESQDIICLIDISGMELLLLGHKTKNKINFIHGTTKIIKE